MVEVVEFVGGIFPLRPISAWNICLKKGSRFVFHLKRKNNPTNNQPNPRYIYVTLLYI